MKSILAILAISLTSSVFAGWTPVTGDEANLIRQAASEALVASDLKCQYRGKDLEKSQMVDVIKSDHMNVFVSEGDEQPAVALIYEKDSTKVEVTITTDDSMKVVVKVDYVQTIYETKTETINIGTIRNPKYETKTSTSLKETLTAECK